MVLLPVLERHPDDAWTLAIPMRVSMRVQRVLHTLADAILPDSPRTETTLHEVTRHALISLRYMPRSSAIAFLLGMVALNWSPLWRLRGVRPLTSLPTQVVRDHLRTATQSPWLAIRMLMYGPRGLFMSCYFDQDYVHQALGYAPQPFVAERIRLRRAWLDGREPGDGARIHRGSDRRAP